MKILVVFGTRPEALKMALLTRKLSATDSFEVKLCVTGQHREMLEPVLNLFELKPDFDLNVMRPGQDLADITSKIMGGLKEVFAEFPADLVLVHGDTTSSFAAALCCFYNKIAIGHVEAGLRTFDLQSPWPEEGNRKLTGALADLHFCPTQKSMENLIRERVPADHVTVTGNTIIDTLLYVNGMLDENMELRGQIERSLGFLDDTKKLLLVTAHRRENFGDGISNICQALRNVAHKNPDVQIVYPVHLNQNIRQPVHDLIGDCQNICLIEPVGYLEFIYLLKKSSIVLTDSGGIQEEAPSFGKPVLVMRDTTERPEAVEAGTVKLVGTDAQVIQREVENLLYNDAAYSEMSRAHNPYGDGNACEQIISELKRYETKNR